MSANSDKNLPVASSAEDFLKREFPPKESLVEGLLSKRDLVTLAGRRREGKTSLGLSLGLSLTDDGTREFLGYAIPQPRRVLLVLLEDDGGEIQDKLRKMVGDRNLHGRLRLLTRDDFFDANVTIDVREKRFRDALLQAVLDHKPDLVVIDNLAHVIAAEYNDATRVHELMNMCYSIAKQNNTAMIICAHPRKDDPKNPINLEKNPTQFFESVMGSSHMVNSTGSLWGIQRKGDYSVFVGGHQRVDGHQGVSYLLMDEQGWLHLDDNPARSFKPVLNTPARKGAWALLPDPSQTFGYAEAEQRVKSAMRSSSTFHKWFSECVRVGMIAKIQDKYRKVAVGFAFQGESAEVPEADEAA